MKDGMQMKYTIGILSLADSWWGWGMLACASILITLYMYVNLP